MAMGAPAAGAQIHFHVSGTRRVIADLQNGAAKIRTAFEAGKTGMKHAHGFSAKGFQFTPPQPLVLPNGLDQPLGGILFIPQKIPAAKARPPPGIKIFGRFDQATLLLEF